jgi:DNA invertase Pin-like site-specific DNA recombinase
MPELYGYARCSTNETKQDINRQVKFLRDKGVSKENIYLEYRTGADANRIELKRVLSLMDEGDTLFCNELSRLTRSIKHLVDIIDQVKEKRLCIILNDFRVDCRNGEIDPTSNITIMILGVVAQWERDIASERIKSGLAYARSRGVKVGRRKITVDNLPLNMLQHYKLYSSGEISQAEYARICNVARPTLRRYLILIEAEAESSGLTADEVCLKLKEKREQQK